MGLGRGTETWGRETRGRETRGLGDVGLGDVGRRDVGRKDVGLTKVRIPFENRVWNIIKRNSSIRFLHNLRNCFNFFRYFSGGIHWTFRILRKQNRECHLYPFYYIHILLYPLYPFYTYCIAAYVWLRDFRPLSRWVSRRIKALENGYIPLTKKAQCNAKFWKKCGVNIT